MLIQLIPNSWAYLLGFAGFARRVLSEKPSIPLFHSMFTLTPANRGKSDHTYALFGLKRGAKKKCRGSLSKVCEWKVNFIVVGKWVDARLEKDAFAPWNFTTH